MRLSLHLKDKIKGYLPHVKKFYNRKLGIIVVSNYLKHYGKLPKKVGKSPRTNGYSVFGQDFRSTNPNPTFRQIAISRQIAIAWENTTKEQKNEFVARAEVLNRDSAEDSASKIIQKYFSWIYDFVFG